VVSRLNDLWPSASQGLFRFFRRANDGHVAWFARIRIRVHNDNQISAIGFRLCAPCAAYFPPTLFLGLATGQPPDLRVCEQFWPCSGERST
jgi:hypothetical protein